MVLVRHLHRRFPCSQLFTYFILLLQVLSVSLIAHDSLTCEKAGTCRPPSHIVLKLHKRDDALAKRIAKRHNMELKGQAFLDSHYFLYHKAGISARRKRSVMEAMTNHPEVAQLIEDRPRKRVKRDLISDDHPFIGPREKRQSTNTNRYFEGRSVPQLPFSDPLYNDQWYLIGRAVGGYDMNVREAWLMGYAGRNVSISILDDGIQRDHLDLVANYDQEASTDINDHDNDPTPQNNGDNKHGTRCAGEVAAIAANDVCGVGVAFHSKIGGVRMLDGPVSDSVEAASLSLNQQHIDIYSASWGPEDDGRTFDGPGNLAQEAFYRGVKQGRNGRGNIFVWASGNGGSRQDSCSADGYTTSIYTLSISSATFDNHRPWYLEECPSTIATTYSSANINQPAIVTVDVPNGCTKMHTGTSASAPLAAGIIALALEANPSLTWRDTQHIVLRTANPTPLLNNPGWSVNGVGRRISNKFGYGLMDATALVKIAKAWKTVPEQHMCAYEYTLDAPRPRSLIGRFKMNFSLEATGCRQGTPVLYLEHVQVVTTIRYQKRGDLTLTLYSPMGTSSVLLPPRPQDFNQNGFHKWPFMSVQMWGEDPRGVWTLELESVTNNPNLAGVFSDWTLLLYGTEDPAQPTDQRYSSYTPSAPRSGQFITSQSEPVSEGPQISFSDLTSAKNCHPECLGCSESMSAVSCFACKHFTQSLRNRAGFRCVSHCDEGYYSDGDKCRKCNGECHSCSTAEICDTCQGAKFLIDVDHFGHWGTRGKCVDKCPDDLMTDYTNSLQARCVLKKNPCSEGYFEDSNGGCSVCHEACATCHGAGPIQCDTCAVNYRNHTIGYCRPCCTPQQLTSKDIGHCEDCTKPITHSPTAANHWSYFHRLVLIFGILLLVILFYCIFKTSSCFEFFWRMDRSGNLEYTPLNNVGNSKVSGGSLDSESSDGEDDNDIDIELGTSKFVGVNNNAAQILSSDACTSTK